MNRKNEQYEKICLKIVGGMSGAHQTACRMQAIRHENQKGFLQTGSLCFLSDFRRQTINISRLSCT